MSEIKRFKAVSKRYSILIPIFVASICILFLATAAVAKGPGAGGPPADSPWKGAQNFKKRIVKELHLSADQSRLHDTMHITRRAFMEKACSDSSNAQGCRNSKLRKRVFHLFRAELAAEKPDFAGAAAKAKNEYHGKFKAEYDAMVDARAAFMSSLTEAQRDKLLQMRPRRGNRGGMR